MYVSGYILLTLIYFAAASDKNAKPNVTVTINHQFVYKYTSTPKFLIIKIQIMSHSDVIPLNPNGCKTQRNLRILQESLCNFLKGKWISTLAYWYLHVCQFLSQLAAIHTPGIFHNMLELLSLCIDSAHQQHLDTSLDSDRWVSAIGVPVCKNWMLHSLWVVLE